MQTTEINSFIYCTILNNPLMCVVIGINYGIKNHCGLGSQILSKNGKNLEALNVHSFLMVSVSAEKLPV